MIKEIIGCLDIEIYFDSKEKTFEDVIDKMFAFLANNFFKDKGMGEKTLRSYHNYDFKDGSGNIKYYDLDLSFFDNFLSKEVEEISKKVVFKDFEFRIVFRYDLYNIKENTISVGNNEHLEFSKNKTLYEYYMKLYKDLNSVLKRIDNGEHIPTVFGLRTLRYFNQISEYNNK